MDSFEQVYELYFKDVYRYILSLCQDASEAEEITQETFYQAMKHMSGFRGDCKMTVWLCQIAKHIYYGSTKKQKRRQDAAARIAELTGYHWKDMQGTQESWRMPSLEHLFSDEAEAMKIHELLHRMEEPYKEVFMLRIFGELPFKKIAHIFGKTENWARVTYHRARLKLICEMGENAETDI